MKYFSNLLRQSVYGLISISLGIISLTMIVSSLWDIWTSLHEKTLLIKALLDSIGLIVIGMAVFDVSKFLLEEEVFHIGGRKSPEKQREALVKFFLIIAIAISLESLVFVFDAGKKDITTLIYPTFLLISAVFVVIGLGIYQKLTKNEDNKE
ncbi:general glycosylation pathway protein [Arcobacter lanthieri]|uniref:general glycosylation pathway protein n=1 Tax=Aliarcobacter lanthieri TaxID=1355374 RepID=UPI00192048F7|nr:general glycosylation pathway protein [Aliarcobacter lanthieri]MBL3518872.1 general glycosylation pathway protein [Aliarcobacter lanthieri]